MSRIDKFGQTARGPQIDVFEGSPAGLGGTVHLWASPVQGTYERLCDGIRWGDHVAWFDHKPGHGVLACLECFWVFHLDHERSQPRLNAPARSLMYLESPCPSLGDTAESDTRMLIIPLNDLAYFYATADERKDRFIGQFKARKAGDGGHYYQPVLGLLRSSHWRTGDLSILESTVPSFLDQERAKDAANPNRRDRAVQYAKVLDSYQEFCVKRRVSGTFAAFARTVVRVTDEVGIRVRPTVGLVTDSGRHVVIVRMSKDPPSRAYRQAVNYFLGLAIRQHPVYLEDRVGLLDVRQKDVLPMLAATAAEEQSIRDHAELFRQMSQP